MFSCGFYLIGLFKGRGYVFYLFGEDFYFSGKAKFIGGLWVLVDGFKIWEYC